MGGFRDNNASNLVRARSVVVARLSSSTSVAGKLSESNELESVRSLSSNVDIVAAAMSLNDNCNERLDCLAHSHGRGEKEKEVITVEQYATTSGKRVENFLFRLELSDRAVCS